MIRVKFAYYNPASEDGEIPPMPSYYIDESDINGLPVGGNVSASSLIVHHVAVPPTPSYDEWIATGSPTYRGQKKSCCARASRTKEDRARHQALFHKGVVILETRRTFQ